MAASLEIRALGFAALAGAIALGAFLLAAVPVRMLTDLGAPRPDASASIPASTSSPQLIEQGRQFFAMSCAHCHGDDAHGDEGPDLYHLPVSNAYISMTIKKGVKGEMPTFAKKYDNTQVAALVAYLRSLH
jgi:mono/diheme cytochrome c family protein